MTDDDLKAIEARLAAVTPGDWLMDYRPTVNADGPDGGAAFIGSILAYMPEEDGVWVFPVAHSLTEQDARFIVHAYCDVPNLIAEVRRLRHVISTALAIGKGQA